MRSTTWTQVGIAALVGAAAAALSCILELRGEWIALCWLAGFVIGLRLPGAQPWMAGMAGIGIGLAVCLTVGGSWTLVVFALAGLGAVYTHGWGGAWLVRRLRKLGAAAARDVPTLLVGVALLSVVVLGGWLALELARNPL
jgi:hypothetical protein